MKKRLPLRRNILLVLLMLPSLWVTAQVRRYVAPGGSNTANNCTLPGSPCLTITHAVSVSNAGDTIRLAAGTYAEATTVTINKANLVVLGSGAASTTVKLQTTNAAIPVFSLAANGASFKDLTLTNDGAMHGGIWVSGATSGLTVDSVRFTRIGTATGAFGTGSQGSGIRFLNSFSGLNVNRSLFSSAHVGATSGSSGIACTATGNPQNAGTASQLSNFSIDSSKFEYLFIGFWSAVPVQSLTVTRNTFGPMETQDATSGSSAIYMGDLIGEIKDILVENNVFNSTSRGFYINSYSNCGMENSRVQQIAIRNNTFNNTIYSSPIRLLTSSDATLEDVAIEDNVINQNSDNNFTDGLAMIDIRQATQSASTSGDNIRINRNCITFSGGAFTKSTWGLLFRGKTTNVQVMQNVLTGNSVGGSSTGMPATSGIVVQTNYAAPFGSMPSDAGFVCINNYVNGFTNGLIFYNQQTLGNGGIPLGASIIVQENHLASNTLAIVNGALPSGQISAESNWFGSTNPGTVASLVTGNVNYTPYLTTDVDLDPAICGNGFQPMMLRAVGNSFTVAHEDYTPSTVDNTDIGLVCTNSEGTANFMIENRTPTQQSYIQQIQVRGPNAGQYAVLGGPFNGPGVGVFATTNFSVRYTGANMVCSTCIDTVVVTVVNGTVATPGRPVALPVITYKFAVRAEAKLLPTAVIAVTENSGNPNDAIVCSAGASVVLTVGTDGNPTFLWSTGSTSGQITVAPASTSTYTVSVTGINGCLNTAMVEIRVNPPIAVTAQVQNSCTEGSGGTVDVSVTGGSNGFRYMWDTGDSTQDLTNVSRGLFVVTVTDVVGCSVFNTFSVGTSPSPRLALAAPDEVCFGNSATVTLSPSEPMRMVYRIDGGTNQEFFFPQGTPRTISIPNVQATTVFTVVSANSLSQGCAIVGGSIVQTIRVTSPPTIVADNIVVCNDETFNILPIRTSQGSNRVLVDWTAQYNGLTGGAGSGSGLVAGLDAVSEALRNSGAVPIVAEYTLSPYVQSNGQRCAGLDYRVRVEVQAVPVVTPVAPVTVCSGEPFRINPAIQNAVNPQLTWSLTSNGNTTQGRGAIEETIINEGTSAQSLVYRMIVFSAIHCQSAPVDVTVTVQPKPLLKLTVPSDICNGVVDLTAASITAGSGPGLVFSYWRDNAQQVAVDNPQKATPGLYYIAARNQAGCVAIGSILVGSVIKLEVQAPAPVCQGGTVDLTASALTLGSEPGLTLSYWLNVDATQAVANPTQVGAGRYYIRASKTGSTCFAIESVEVRELLPQLLNKSGLQPVCTGTPFGFTPRSNIEGAIFQWSRAVQSGISNPAASGSGSISEVLNLSGGASVSVLYTYSLSAPGCGNVGAENGTLSVMVQPPPVFTVRDTFRSCSPTVDLNTLILSNPSNNPIRFSFDAAGTNLVANPTAALLGRYFAVSSSNSGCSRSLPVVVRSQLQAVPVSFDTLLEFCPPNRINLPTFVGRYNFPGTYQVTYFRDPAATQAVSNPASVGEGLYYVVIRDTTIAGNCRAILPIEVAPALARLDSELDPAEHCGGTLYTYIPTSRQSGVTFTWFIAQEGSADTLRGSGNISVVLNNSTNARRSARVKIFATRNVCPLQPTTQYLLEVDVLPRPSIVPIAPPSPLNSGDSVLLNVVQQSNIPVARFNWAATYGTAVGGQGGQTLVRFGPKAVREQLYNFADAIAKVNYLLTPVLPGNKMCFGTPVTVPVDVEADFPQGPASIGGAVRTKFGIGVEGVDLKLSGQSRFQSRASSTDGRFLFSGLRLLYDYTVQPELDKDPLNGVSTRDLIAIQRHLLGMRVLTDPYDLIAADANGSRSISISDVVLIRRVILGLDERFTNNTSWRFVDAAHKFQNPTTPWSPGFPEFKNFNDLWGQATDADFVGVKIGDITGDAQANPTTGIAPRSGRAVQLEVADRAVSVGDRIQVPVRFKGSDPVEGMQFTLAYNPRALRLITWESVFPDAEGVGLFNEDGLVTYSQYKPLKDGESLMVLSFEVTRPGKLSDWIDLNDRITSSEAYVGETTRALGLAFALEGNLDEQPRVAQNYPNPFSGRTVVPFWIPQEEQIRLRVFDVTGKQVLERTAVFSRGQHQFELDVRQLQGAGVWYYQISGSDWVETKQMVRF